jgi:hypothetical protein
MYELVPNIRSERPVSLLLVLGFAAMTVVALMLLLSLANGLLLLLLPLPLM